MHFTTVANLGNVIIRLTSLRPEMHTLCISSTIFYVTCIPLNHNTSTLYDKICTPQ